MRGTTRIWSSGTQATLQSLKAMWDMRRKSGKKQSRGEKKAEEGEPWTKKVYHRERNESVRRRELPAWLWARPASDPAHWSWPFLKDHNADNVILQQLEEWDPLLPMKSHLKAQWSWLLMLLSLDCWAQPKRTAWNSLEPSQPPCNSDACHAQAASEVHVAWACSIPSQVGDLHFAFPT